MREIFRLLIAGQRTDEPGGVNCAALSVKLNSLFSLGCGTLCIPNCLAGEKIINNQGSVVSVVRFRDWLPNSDGFQKWKPFSFSASGFGDDIAMLR